MAPQIRVAAGDMDDGVQKPEGDENPSRHYEQIVW
jgi:hypothetical protein